MKRSIQALLLAIPCSWISIWLPVGLAAGNDFADGLNLYNQKNYRGAALKFESAMRTRPSDSAVYYCALANQMGNNRARARQLYEYLNSSFPGSKFSPMATSALRSLGDVGASASTGVSSSSGSSSYSGSSSRSSSAYSGPTQFSVPFKRGRFNNGQGGVYLDVLVNNRPMTFHLDTGAHGTVMGDNQLQELGLSRPPAGEKHFSTGVGEREKIPTWSQKLDLKLGNIYMRDFEVSVADHYEGEPLLGRDFLRDWDVAIDENNRQATFTRRGATGAVASASRSSRSGRGIIDVPFTLEGRHMIVDGFVNSRPYKFYFDTGADNVCFSMKDLKKLGLEDALSSAEQGYSIGVGGRTPSYSFPINSLKVGPIVKENFKVTAVENSQMDHPLLGQTFFGSYNVLIDEANKVIHFKPND
jgi:predicted aspartyl protease